MIAQKETSNNFIINIATVHKRYGKDKKHSRITKKT